jgi:Tfp pilus assembly protein PilN
MKSINFIPPSRLAARRRRRKMTRRAAATGGYVALLLGGLAFLYSLWGGSPPALAEDQAKTSARILLHHEKIQEAQRDLAACERLLQANQVIRNQPDWSLLLALVAGSLNEGVVLTQCELKPDALPQGSAAPATAPPPGAGMFSLKLAGRGQSMAAVLQFVRELEHTGLFDEVDLVQTNWEPFLAGKVVGFQVECMLSDKGKAST